MMNIIKENWKSVRQGLFAANLCLVLKYFLTGYSSIFEFVFCFVLFNICLFCVFLKHVLPIIKQISILLTVIIPTAFVLVWLEENITKAIFSALVAGFATIVYYFIIALFFSLISMIEDKFKAK